MVQQLQSDKQKRVIAEEEAAAERARIDAEQGIVTGTHNSHWYVRN